MPRCRNPLFAVSLGRGLALLSLLAITAPGASARAEIAAQTLAAMRVVQVYQPGLLAVAGERGKGPFRLIGIDAVQRSDGPIGNHAVAAVREWVQGPLTLELLRRNPQGEGEGVVILADGRSLNERLLQNGYAIWNARGHEGPLVDALRAAQEEGRLRRIGIWAAEGVPVEQLSRIRHRIGRFCGDAAEIRRDDNRDWRLFLGDPPPRHSLEVRVPLNRSEDFAQPMRNRLRHKLCIVGRLERRQDMWEISVFDETQIEDEGGTRGQ